MVSSQISLKQTESPDHGTANAAEPGGKRVSKHRARAVRIFVSLVTLTALLAGGWGFLSSFGAEAVPSRVGEMVEVRGGLFRVDKVAPGNMQPAHEEGKPAESGTSMPGSGMDMAPEGQRSFTLDVTLIAREGDLPYSGDRFRLSGEGIKESGPVRNQLNAGTVPQGSAVSGSLVFQAPEEAKGLRLSFDGGTPVALDLEPGKLGGSHDGGSEAEDHDGGR